MHAIEARHVAGRRDHAAAAAADDHRLVAQFRAVALLDTGVEGIAIDVGERQAVEVRVPEHAQTAAGRAARRGCGAGWLRNSLEAVAAEPRHDSGGRRQGLRQPLRPPQPGGAEHAAGIAVLRSEEQTSKLPSLMRNSYAVFCLKKK